MCRASTASLGRPVKKNSTVIDTSLYQCHWLEKCSLKPVPATKRSNDKRRRACWLIVQRCASNAGGSQKMILQFGSLTSWQCHYNVTYRRSSKTETLLNKSLTIKKLYTACQKCKQKHLFYCCFVDQGCMWGCSSCYRLILLTVFMKRFLR